MLPKRCDGLPKLQELLFRLAYQFHEDVPLPAALATKAPHDFCQLLVEALGLTLSSVARRLHCWAMCSMSSRVFFALYTAWWHR